MVPPPILAGLAVGALAALAAALQVPPLAAFVCALLLTFLAIFALKPRRASSEVVVPEPVPVPRSEPVGDPMPTAFGRALIEKLPTPLLIVTRTGRVSYANPAAHEALPRLQQGAHFASLIRAPAFVEAVTATLADGDERRVSFAAHHGRERFFEARVGLLPPDSAFGPEALAIVQIEDRTETRRSEQLRSDFIANASHELRTPLASIIGYIETLQNHARNDPDARERFLGIMSREAGRMQRLVDDLMSLSRIELTEHVRPVEEWSLNQIAAESATALQPIARQQGVTLQIDVPTVGSRVLGDRDQLYQVFTNLIDNAMKYGGSGATVRVFAAAPNRAHPNRWGVTVADDGPGIPREHIHRLTERFYRVNVASSRNKGGTGLGLAIAKHILNRHEGRLEVVSTLGSGSTFTVWLPRGAPRRRRSRRIPALRMRPPRICVPPEPLAPSQNRRKNVTVLCPSRLYCPCAGCGAGTPRRMAQEQDVGMAHIVSAFDEDLVQVQAKISEMGGLSEELLAKALQSVQDRDTALAREVIERDRAIDAMEMALEESVVKVIALRQPVAADLRVLIAAMKIASTLERIGDLAKNIAKRAIPLSSAKPVRPTTSIVRMGRQTLTQLSDVLNAHASRDVDLAVQIWNQDYEIDELYNAIFREVVTYMVEDSRLIGVGAQLMFIAKNLERIGDHSTHISEMVYYIVTGNSLGDDRPKGEPTGIDFIHE